MSEIQRRRKLRKIISDPLEEFNKAKRVNRLIFVERDHDTAMLTRAAVGMYIGRHGMEMTTRVVGSEIWVLKSKDITEPSMKSDIREWWRL